MPGKVLYDFNNKSIKLQSVGHDDNTGNIVFEFATVNESEATDFVPRVEGENSRVTERGILLDTDGKTLAVVSVSGNPR